MKMNVRRAALAALLLGVSAGAVMAEMAAPTAPPEAPKFEAQTEPVYVNRSDIFEYKALPAYSEPAWVTAFVDAGKLPP
ncbi:MAG TPA: ABC transporter substrate-binding protein, partial [Tabrizicola sp.]|nr:ABC transporter substrate-binding protein [Tabrizicola sp.]